MSRAQPAPTMSALWLLTARLMAVESESQSSTPVSTVRTHLLSTRRPVNHESSSTWISLVKAERTIHTVTAHTSRQQQPATDSLQKVNTSALLRERSCLILEF